MKLLVAIAAALFVLAAAPDGTRAAELVMFEEPGCTWCARWNAEIGGAYAKTEEGRQAPLRRVSLDAPRPADLAKVQAVSFSPTFVVMDGGREYGRIVGYPGEDFFWPMLRGILATLPGETQGTSLSLRMP